MLLFCLMSTSVGAAESVCYGSTSNGRLEGGVQLPGEGSNFVSYSDTAALLGRTYVHSVVRRAVVGAYGSLESSLPDKVFKYAETGLQGGGPFSPHKTHQNGLSVDFMVPVIDRQGRSVHLPTHYFNKLGYAVEFNWQAEYDGLRIDFEAMAAHLAALHRAAQAEGIDIWRVIFDPDLQPKLWQTEQGAYLKKHLTFSTRRSWVRHDEHYHVDFSVACRPM